MLSILRYADELRDPKPYFEGLNFEPKSEAVGLAKELIEAESGRFEPEKMPDKYAETLHELLQSRGHLKSRLPLRARLLKSSTSWPRSNRVWSPRDAPRCVMLCGEEWASPRKRRQHRELQGPDQAHAGRRIECVRCTLTFSLVSQPWFLACWSPVDRRRRWHCHSSACLLSRSQRVLRAAAWFQRQTLVRQPQSSKSSKLELSSALMSFLVSNASVIGRLHASNLLEKGSLQITVPLKHSAALWR